MRQSRTSNNNNSNDNDNDNDDSSNNSNSSNNNNSLLPSNKHAFLSYQWNVQDKVLRLKNMLNQRGLNCWMDIDGGMQSDIYDSMAEGVQGAACVVCFMTPAYQDSANCKLELKFAQQSGVPVLPVMMAADYTPSGWLGIITAGNSTNHLAGLELP